MVKTRDINLRQKTKTTEYVLENLPAFTTCLTEQICVFQKGSKNKSGDGVQQGLAAQGRTVPI